MNRHLDEELFIKFISGNLSDEIREDVLNHLISCKICRDDLAFFAKVSQPSINLEEACLLTQIFPQSMKNYSHHILNALKNYQNKQKKSNLQKFYDSLRAHTFNFLFAFSSRIKQKRIAIPSIAVAIALLLFLFNPIGKYLDYRAMSLIQTGNKLLIKNITPIYTMPLRPYGGFSWIEFNHQRGGEINKIRAQGNDIKPFFQKALEIRKNNSEVLSYAGNFYLVLGNFKKAKDLFERARALQSDNTIASNGLGIIYYAKNDIDKAIEFFLLAKQSNPKFLEARYNLALVYQKMRKYQEARKEWHSYLKMDSVSDWANNARNMLKEIE